MGPPLGGRVAHMLLVCCIPGGFPWSYLMAILEQKNGADTELQVYAMTLINKVSVGKVGQDVSPGLPLSILLVLCRHWPPSLTRTPSMM